MSSLVFRCSAASHRRVFSAMAILLLKLTRQREGARYITVLGPLVAAAQQNHNDVAAPGEINAVARTVIDPHFRHPTPHRLYVPGMAERQAADPSRDAGARPMVA